MMDTWGALFERASSRHSTATVERIRDTLAERRADRSERPPAPGSASEGDGNVAGAENENENEYGGEDEHA